MPDPLQLGLGPTVNDDQAVMVPVGAGLDEQGGHESWTARRLVLATPAASAASLVRAFDAEAADWIASVEYAPVASLALAAGAA